MPLKSDPEYWTDERHRRGLIGERAALSYFENSGWRLLAHRFRLGHSEIDLIVRKGRLVAFAEVKTRRSSSFGSPLEAITWSKRREICRVALGWLDRYGNPRDVYRFDVVGVNMSRGGNVTIEHIEDAFRPGWR